MSAEPASSPRDAPVLLDEGDPAQDARAFRRCLGQFATGLTVVTTRSGDTHCGLTVNSFASLSLDPPLVLFCIDRRSGSLPTFLEATHFAVNILGSRQIHLSRHFANPSVEKFSNVPWRMGRTGVPILADVVAHLECRRVATHDGGDHVIVVGHVEHYARYEGEALLFVQGRYGVPEDHPEAATRPASPAGAGAEPRSSLLMLLFRAYHAVSASFQSHREEAGITLAQGRILAELYENPGLAFEALVRATYLARSDAEDAIAELVEAGLVERDAGGLLDLTDAGRARRELILAKTATFEAERTSGMTEAQIASGRAFLQALIRSGERSGARDT
ncbi:MAG: flavin reductase [Burkholderiales bacterium]